VRKCSLIESYHCERWQCENKCNPPPEYENETITSEQAQQREGIQPQCQNNKSSQHQQRTHEGRD